MARHPPSAQIWQWVEEIMITMWALLTCSPHTPIYEQENCLRTKIKVRGAGQMSNQTMLNQKALVTHLTASVRCDCCADPQH